MCGCHREGDVVSSSAHSKLWMESPELRAKVLQKAVVAYVARNCFFCLAVNVSVFFS
jgi:hypothetical protein